MRRPPHAYRLHGCRNCCRRRASDRGAKSSAGFAKGGCKSTGKCRRSAPSCRGRPHHARRATGPLARAEGQGIARAAVSPLARRNPRSAGGDFARRGAPEPAALLGPLARDSAHAAGGWRPRNPHRRRIVGASGFAGRARAHRRLCAANARPAQRGIGRGVSRRDRLRRGGDDRPARRGAVRRGLQSLAERHRARDSLGAGAPLVGGAGHHRQPADARALRTGAFVARFAPRPFTRHVGKRTQRIDQRDRRRESRLRGASCGPELDRSA